MRRIAFALVLTLFAPSAMAWETESVFPPPTAIVEPILPEPPQPNWSHWPTFIVGCWQSPSLEGTLNEVWERPARTVMFGYGMTLVQGDGVLAWEQMRITPNPEGGVMLSAMPFGRDAVSFHATQLTEGVAVFENPTHDYPQWIAYRRIDPDTLEVSFGAAGEESTVLRMERGPCPQHGAVGEAP